MNGQQTDFFNRMFGLNGRVAIVTGGNGRLGTEFVRSLADAGARVAVFDISETNETLTELAKTKTITFHKVDITDEKAVCDGFASVRDLWGVPTILVNNAGWKASPNARGQGGVSFEKYPIDVWEDVFRINTTAAAICSKVCGGMLIGAGVPGVIVNIASVYATIAPDQRIYEYRREKGLPVFIKDASYSASKAALVAFTRDLAVQWAPHNIRVVAISPGGVLHDGSDEEFVKRYASRVPLGRMARTEDLCGALIFLVSDAASYITGTNMLVDGGMSCW